MISFHIYSRTSIKDEDERIRKAQAQQDAIEKQKLHQVAERLLEEHSKGTETLINSNNVKPGRFRLPPQGRQRNSSAGTVGGAFDQTRQVRSVSQLLHLQGRPPQIQEKPLTVVHLPRGHVNASAQCNIFGGLLELQNKLASLKRLLLVERRKCRELRKQIRKMNSKVSCQQYVLFLRRN